jgi:hypothetical protein
MKYVCLIHGDPAVWDALPKAALRAIEEEHLAYDAALIASGNFLAAQALAPAEAATIVRVRNGRISTTDGPSPRPRSSSAASF